METKLSYEYIRGLIEGEGCFTFHPVYYYGSGNYQKSITLKAKIPTFSLGMSSQDTELLRKVKISLCLRNKIYEYSPRYRKDGYKRQGTAMLLVRDVGQLKNIIIPVFYNKLHGNKKKQFLKWLNEIGEDPLVPERFKFLYRLYKLGYYDQKNWITEKFVIENR